MTGWQKKSPERLFGALKCVYVLLILLQALQELFLLHQLHIMQSYGALTYNVEDIINEYDVLERLAVSCGKKIVSNYAINGSNLNVYLEFVP